MKKYLLIIEIIILFTLIYIFFSCNKKTAKNTNFLNLTNFDWCDINGMKLYGRDVIPICIDSISIKRKGLIGYIDKYKSSFEPCQINNYIGIGYAYSIEHILGLNTLISKMVENNDTSICNYRIYHLGVIQKLVNNKMINDTLSFQEILKIKNIYKQWWLVNKQKNLQQLQKDWELGNRALKNSDFVWK